MEQTQNTKTPYQDFTLLVDGKNAFPEIIRTIDEAEHSVKINMFIWRDDTIGNRLAAAVLQAAKRGVKVEISVDRYGVVLEKSEEVKKSFFHKTQTLTEKIKIRSLELFYPMPNTPKKAKDESSALYEEIIAHPNITIEADEFKADHSKYYIIDDKILIFGGVNVEDKENGADMQGRAYQDYMIKLYGEEYVSAFEKKLLTGENFSTDYLFGINVKKPVRRFEMEKLYLDMIREAKSKLYITMAYFSPLKPFVKAIVAAVKRGVEVTVMVPKNANYQNDSNMKTVKKLMKLTGNKICLYFSPKMLHTKMIVTEDWISFGSTNITKKAFQQLNELNIFLKNVDSEVKTKLMQSMQENHALSEKINTYKRIKYNAFAAFVEGFLV